MSPVAGPSPSVERLAHELAGLGPASEIVGDLTKWLAGPGRFRAFAEANRLKIRKKLRNAADPDAVRDVRAELLAARLLLTDRRIELAFEAHGSGKGGPDFTVTIPGQRSFNLEVTRLHRVPSAARFGPPLLAKIRQLPPSVPNAVLVAIGAEAAAALDVAAAIRLLRARADAGDDAFFGRHGFKGTGGFRDRFLRLGAVLVWSEDATADDRVALWANPSARIAVPERGVRACVACLRFEE